MFDPGYGDITVAPYCLPEVLASVEGEMLIAGIASTAVSGENIAAKTHAITEFTKEQLLEHVKESGFMYRLNPGSTLSIPAGMIILKIAKGPAAHLRWG